MKYRGCGRSRECIDVRKLLDAFADDELAKRELAKVIRHLNNCTMCAEELQNIQDLCCMLSTIPCVMPEKQLAFPRLVQQTDRLSTKKTWWKQPCKYVACAAVFLLGFWTSWKTSDQLMKLFKAAANKNEIVSKDCYVASWHPLHSALHLHYTKHRANI
jgi:anti-sigma factor RsiW